MEQTLPNGNSLFIRSENGFMCVLGIQKGFDSQSTQESLPFQYPLKQLLANSVNQNKRTMQHIS